MKVAPVPATGATISKQTINYLRSRAISVTPLNPSPSSRLRLKQQPTSITPVNVQVRCRAGRWLRIANATARLLVRDVEVDWVAREQIREEVAGARRYTLSRAINAEPEHRLRLRHNRSSHPRGDETVRVSLAVENRDRLLKPDRALG